MQTSRFTPPWTPMLLFTLPKCYSFARVYMDHFEKSSGRCKLSSNLSTLSSKFRSLVVKEYINENLLIHPQWTFMLLSPLSNFYSLPLGSIWTSLKSPELVYYISQMKALTLRNTINSCIIISDWCIYCLNSICVADDTLFRIDLHVTVASQKNLKE